MHSGAWAIGDALTVSRLDRGDGADQRCPEDPELAQTKARWKTLDDLLRDLAMRVSESRGRGADKERNLGIWLRYRGLEGAGDRTLDGVGAAYGLTRERVRQIVTGLTSLVADELEHAALDGPRSAGPAADDGALSGTGVRGRRGQNPARGDGVAGDTTQPS